MRASEFKYRGSIVLNGATIITLNGLQVSLPAASLLFHNAASGFYHVGSEVTVIARAVTITSMLIPSSLQVNMPRARGWPGHCRADVPIPNSVRNQLRRLREPRLR